MSYVDAARGGTDLKVRKTYYYRVTGTVPNVMTVNIKDQLPQSVVMRVSAAAALAGVTVSLNSSTMLELRLYDAFTCENIYDSSQFAPGTNAVSGGYVILGYFTVIMGAGASTAGQYVFMPCAPVVSRSTGNGQWRVVLYNVATGAPVAAGLTGNAFSMAVDVRAGGSILYAN